MKKKIAIIMCAILCFSSLAFAGCSNAISEEDRSLLNNAYETGSEFLDDKKQNDLEIINKLKDIRDELSEGNNFDSSLITKLDNISTKIEDSANKLDISEELAAIAEEIATAVERLDVSEELSNIKDQLAIADELTAIAAQIAESADNTDILEKLGNIADNIKGLKEKRIYTKDQIKELFKFNMYHTLSHATNYKIMGELVSSKYGVETKKVNVSWAKYIDVENNKLYMVSTDDYRGDGYSGSGTEYIYSETNLLNMSTVKYSTLDSSKTPEVVEGVPISDAIITLYTGIDSSFPEDIDSTSGDTSGDDGSDGDVSSEFITVSQKHYYTVNSEGDKTTIGIFSEVYVDNSLLNLSSIEFSFIDGMLVSYSMSVTDLSTLEKNVMNYVLIYDITKADVDEIYSPAI